MYQRHAIYRKVHTSWRLIVLALVATGTIVQAQSASAVWALDVIPSDGPLLDLVTVCRDGMFVGVAAQDEFAFVDGDEERWEMSIVRSNSEDGEPIREVKLDLEEADSYLTRYNEQYPYRQYRTIRWSPTLNQSERLAINFNDREWRSVVPIRVEDCWLGDIDHRIEVVGDDSRNLQVDDELEFEVSANHCNNSNDNGCGIHHVHFFVIDPFGEIVHEKLERSAEYCAFGGSRPCSEYDFSDNNNRWPNGDFIEEGEHLLRAVIRANNGTITVIQEEVYINPY